MSVSGDMFRSCGEHVAHVVANLQTCWSVHAYGMGLNTTDSVASIAALLINPLKAEDIPRMILWEEIHLRSSNPWMGRLSQKGSPLTLTSVHYSISPSLKHYKHSSPDYFSGQPRATIYKIGIVD